jgi:hypothetical protein
VREADCGCSSSLGPLDVWLLRRSQHGCRPLRLGRLGFVPAATPYREVSGLLAIRRVECLCLDLRAKPFCPVG